MSNNTTKREPSVQKVVLKTSGGERPQSTSLDIMPTREYSSSSSSSSSSNSSSSSSSSNSSSSSSSSNSSSSSSSQNYSSSFSGNHDDNMSKPIKKRRMNEQSSINPDEPVSFMKGMVDHIRRLENENDSLRREKQVLCETLDKFRQPLVNLYSDQLKEFTNLANTQIKMLHKTFQTSANVFQQIDKICTKQIQEQTNSQDE